MPARCGTHDLPACRDLRDARGFSLMEAIVATVIAVIAAIGLAYTFGVGRANVNRFELARVADALAQSRMEFLGLLLDTAPSSDSLREGVHPATANAFRYHGAAVGSEYWIVSPAPASVPSTVRPVMMQLTSVVTWTLGGFPDSVVYSRVAARP